MYLIPRLIGVFTYFVITIFFFLLLRKSNKKNVNQILFVYAIILSVIGFFYVPAQSADLSRIWDTMKDFSTNSFKELSDFALSTNIPFFYFSIYFISLTNIYSILPAIVAFIFYLNSFYIIKDYSKKKNFSSKTIAMTVFVFMCFGQFLQVISGIRSLLSFSIIARCIYDEYINNKSILKNISWYFIASTIHPAALALVLIHLIITLILSNKISKLKKMTSIFIIFLILIIFGHNYIEAMLSAAESYLSEESYSYIWEYIMALAYLILFLCTIIKVNNNQNNLLLYKKYLIIFSTITCLFISVYSIFQRYTVFISILASPLFMEAINAEQKCAEQSQYTSKKYLQLIFFGSLAILVLACARGNLSGLKFFM